MGWFRDLGKNKPWAQGCLVAAAGLVLSVSGCFGFLLTLNLNGGGNRGPQELISMLGGIGFVLGGLAIVVGFIWWLVALLRSRQPSPVSPPPPPPPPPADPAS